MLGDEGPVFRMPSLSSLLTFLIFALVLLSFFWIKYISLDTSIQHGDLKVTIIEAINKLRKSFRHEAFFLVILFVLLFVTARIFSQINGNGMFWDIFRKDILLSLMAGLSIFGFYIFKRYRHYKRNILELKIYLLEFEEGINK